MKKLLLIILCWLPLISRAEIEFEDMEFYINDEENLTCGLLNYNGNEKEVIIPEFVTFEGINYKVNKIHSSAFRGNKYIEYVYIPNSVDVIDGSAFKESSIKEVRLPETLKKIEAQTFSECTKLENLILPETIEEIGGSAFWNCYNFAVNLPSKIKKIETYAFYYNSTQYLKIPKSVEYIGDRAFARNNSLDIIIIEDSDESLVIGKDCFIESPMSYLSLGRNIIADSYVFGSRIQTIQIGSFVNDLSWLNSSYYYTLNQIVTTSSTPPTLGQMSQEEYENITVYIPSANFNKYENDPSWSFFKKLINLNVSLDDYSLILKTTALNINVGENFQIDYEIIPTIETNIFTYTIGNSVRKVYEKEFDFYGSQQGEADLYYILPLNNKQYKCNVTVIQQPNNIYLNKTKVSLQKGESTTILAKVEPEDSNDLSVLWSSTDETIATVNNGLVSAIGGGTCEIIASTVNGLEAKCEVEVLVEPEEISLNYTEIEINIGVTFTLEASISPEDVYPKVELEWSSSDNSIAEVKEGKVIGISSGSAIITVTCEGLSAPCLVNVIQPIVYPQEIILNISEAEIELGRTIQLEATVLPEETTDKSILWTSSDQQVASVSEEGFVEAISLGYVIITATCGDVSANCEITVVEDAGVESLFMNSDDAIDIYSPSGVLVKKNANSEDLKTLYKGIYVLKSKGKSYKINLK